MARQRTRGFTLVEVLVALAIMAVVATLTWRGIDGMTRSQQITQDAMDRTLRLGTVLSQWERDLQSVQQGSGVPALAFDGANLRLTREAEGGLQLVAWSMRDGALWRWASPPLTRSSEIQEYWMRSQQLMGDEPGTLRVLGEVQALRVYFYRGNGWSNAQSAGDVAAPPAAPAPPPPGASGPAPAPAPQQESLPTGVRLQLALPDGLLTRDVLMTGQGY